MFLLAEPLWLRKITTESHILAHVNTMCPDDRYQKLKISTSELIFAPPPFFFWRKWGILHGVAWYIIADVSGQNIGPILR